MKLFYYDKFLESYSNLPKGIQKKVQDFIKKFKNNPKQPSIHLEPISTFKDKNLRTARVDQQYRAILHFSPSGDIFHLLWVDNHDEAMDWAQNKIFEWNKKTQAYQVYETDESKEVQKSEEIYSTFCSNFSDEQLLSIGTPYPLLPSVKTINDYPDLEALEKYLPRDAFENIFQLLDGISIEEIINDIEEGLVENENAEEELTSTNNRRIFFEVKDDSDIEEFLNGDLSLWKIFLHPSQRSIVENDYNGSFKLTGAAGTGKTVVAIHRLKYLSERINKTNGIFFTTFTKSLVKNLEENIRGLGVNLNNVVISNIHSYIVSEAKRLKLIVPDAKIIEFLDHDSRQEFWKEVVEFKLSEFDIEFLIKEYENVILLNNVKDRDDYLRVPRIGLETPLGRKNRLRVWEIIEYYQKLKHERGYYHLDEITNKLTEYYQSNEKPFESIIADEIQDFSDTELRLLRSMVPERQNDLFLVGDPLQKIYQRQLNYSRAGINIRGRRSKRLKINYRTTEEIKKSAVSVIKNVRYDDFDGAEEAKAGYLSLMHGERPSYEIYNDIESMSDAVKNIIHKLSEDSDIDLSSICVGARTKRSMDLLKKYIHNQEISYYDIPRATGDTKGIRLSTFHNMKGLEFKVVILYDVSDRTVPLIHNDYELKSEKEKKDYLNSEKSLLYVAMSRAIQRLYILGRNDKSKLLSIF